MSVPRLWRFTISFHAISKDSLARAQSNPGVLASMTVPARRPPQLHSRGSMCVVTSLPRVAQLIRSAAPTS